MKSSKIHPELGASLKVAKRVRGDLHLLAQTRAARVSNAVYIRLVEAMDSARMLESAIKTHIADEVNE